MKPTSTFVPPFDKNTMIAAIEAAPDTPTSDSDNPPTCPEDWKGAVISCSFNELKTKLAARKKRGLGKALPKTLTAIRFDPDVLAGLKATGKGWQTRVNNAMREWLKAQ